MSSNLGLNKGIKLLIKSIVVLAFVALLFSVATDEFQGRIELALCTVATIGTYIIFLDKKKSQKN